MWTDLSCCLRLHESPAPIEADQDRPHPGKTKVTSRAGGRGKADLVSCVRVDRLQIATQHRERDRGRDRELAPVPGPGMAVFGLRGVVAVMAELYDALTEPKVGDVRIDPPELVLRHTEPDMGPRDVELERGPLSWART